MKPKAPSLAIAYSTQKHAKKKMSHGGMMKHRDARPADEHYDSIADAIMRKNKMADGGMVDLEANSEEMPNYYDDLNEMAAGEEQYDDSQLSAQPEDSNEMGDDIESDKHDMIESIRKKMKKKV